MACTNVNGSLVDRNVNFIFFIHLNYVSCVTYVSHVTYLTHLL